MSHVSTGPAAGDYSPIAQASDSRAACGSVRGALGAGEPAADPAPGPLNDSGPVIGKVWAHGFS
ncbi:hypothetical protein [Streptosporangium canum]|uniref:hypothetical protein n=1 Tax=Streptosporangium canum TaxID=324952 RepID=UPI00378FC5C4